MCTWHRFTRLALAAMALMLCTPLIAAQTHKLVFSCKPDNDLFKVASASGVPVERFDSPEKAITFATSKSGVLLLADGYPTTRTVVSESLLKQARNKDLRLFIEYPESLPGLQLDAPKQVIWERGVVASDWFQPQLAPMRIFSMHACSYLPTTANSQLLSLARVAGYDSAIYGLPKDAAPLLLELPEFNALVATSALSNFVTGRYAPVATWRGIWQGILRHLDPKLKTVNLKWTPEVHPRYKRDEKLPRNAEMQALHNMARFFLEAHVLITPENERFIKTCLVDGVETVPMMRGNASAHGDGSLGMMEGFASEIHPDGQQPQRTPVRADCIAEAAMVLALDAGGSTTQSATIARNLLDFVYVNSAIQGGIRSDPNNPAYGLVAWGLYSPAWEKQSYGDDSARVLLASLVAASTLKDTKWDEAFLRLMKACFRTTGKTGFRGDVISFPDLEKQGWKTYNDANKINLSPHFESYLWACYLWGYRHTGDTELLEKTKKAIRSTMEGYPTGWRLGDNSERSRMLLCLAWLVRVEDTPEHRGWLTRVADDLLANQQPCGAIRERLGGTGGGHYQIPQSNEAYGTGETPLIQRNGDPVSDQLYTTGFTLLGLHEAVAATGDKKLKACEDRLADYLCRIQATSEKHPQFNGSWLRAFDYNLWDYWASSADAGWGAWSVEAGWGGAWTAATLALRAQHKSVWDLTDK